MDRWGESAPDRIAHRSGDRALTFGELRRHSDALAGWLVERLGPSRAPVAVLGHKEPEMLVAFLAVVKSGRAYIPLDLSLPAQRIASMVASAGAVLMLTPDSVRAALAEAAPFQPSHHAQPDDPFYLIFTSGSTGEPKGVVITHGCLAHFLAWMTAEHGFGARPETFLNQAPFSFDLSVMDLYLSLTTGGTLVSITREAIASPKLLYQTLAQSGVTTWVSTPSFAQMCLVERSFAGPMLPELRRFLFCGETLANETAAQLLDRFPAAEVWNTYGPTEATVATTSIRIDRAVLAKHSPLPVGRVMSGTRVEIVEENGAPLAEGERGEIVIAGPNVSPGYWQRPDLTEKVFFKSAGERAYRTGDWGRLRGDLLFCEGRKDGQIKLHGYRIELGDIEAHLRALPQVADAAVLVVEKHGQPDSLAAFLVLREPGTGSDFERALDFKQQLAERLPSYMIPRKFCFMDAFPMTPNGKADRRALGEMLRA